MRFFQSEQGITVLLVDQGVRRCVRVSITSSSAKVDAPTEALGRDEELHKLIAKWVDCRIDA